ncbi:MAG: hypothetical protein MHPSP_002042, partial [Paramarteilia canceri]
VPLVVSWILKKLTDKTNFVHNLIIISVPLIFIAIITGVLRYVENHHFKINVITGLAIGFGVGLFCNAINLLLFAYVESKY